MSARGLSTYPDTRAGDEQFLALLDFVAHERSGAVQARYGLTRGQVAGIRTRYNRPDPAAPDKCRRKANKDGGMPRRWWAS
ncbi:hypothetical protein [uncultured Mameliella sp.]|uniref:hypothetical protein n=1 Tax=uncultured Mameliella sp. TaxID=1447087 RepID=UPI0026232139|nr:hypothetical protein [uncultured Mameliella sp.]